MAGIFVQGCRYAVSWYNLSLTFDFVIVTVPLKSPNCVTEIVRCKRLILGRHIGCGCMCAISWGELILTADLDVIPVFEILSVLFLENCKA